MSFVPSQEVLEELYDDLSPLMERLLLAYLCICLCDVLIKGLSDSSCYLEVV